MKIKELINVSNISDENLLIGEISNTSIRTYNGVKKFETSNSETNNLNINKGDHIRFVAELPVDNENVPTQNDMNVYILINDDRCIYVDTYKGIPNLNDSSCLQSVLDNFEPFKSINLILRTGLDESDTEEYSRDSTEFHQLLESTGSKIMAQINKFYYKTYWTSANNKIKWSKLDNSVQYIRYYEIISKEEFEQNTELYNDFSSPTAFTTDKISICVNEFYARIGMYDDQPTATYTSTPIELSLSSLHEYAYMILPGENYYIFDSSTAYEVVTYLLRFYVGKFNISFHNKKVTYAKINYYLNKIHNSDNCADERFNTITLLYLAFYNFETVFLSDIMIGVFRTSSTLYTLKFILIKDKSFNVITHDDTQEMISSITIEDDGVTDDFYIVKYKCDEVDQNTPYQNNLCIPSVLTTEVSTTNAFFPVFSIIGRNLEISANEDEPTIVTFANYSCHDSEDMSHLNSLVISKKYVTNSDAINVRPCSHD